jgi:hypothetical protein
MLPALFLIRVVTGYGYYAAPNINEPMSKSVVSFTKQTAQVTPYWLLQQMAAIDAVLIFKLARDPAHIDSRSPDAQVPPQWP